MTSQILGADATCQTASRLICMLDVSELRLAILSNGSNGFAFRLLCRRSSLPLGFFYPCRAACPSPLYTDYPITSYVCFSRPISCYTNTPIKASIPPLPSSFVAPDVQSFPNGLVCPFGFIIYSLPCFSQVFPSSVVELKLFDQVHVSAGPHVHSSIYTPPNLNINWTFACRYGTYVSAALAMRGPVMANVELFGKCAGACKADFLLC
ncbi:hypothetical protein BDN70DRAFT_268980 [Pholiota conissans]|uniref:Uncharacterized protein n=1 Tax=Pholiota conissans TaxID=109636 RepID=A0A9P6CW02_9AGAR|nr:hypothetical protein BDN70DRAFT_268980 [Pholiota conissans]